MPPLVCIFENIRDNRADLYRKGMVMVTPSRLETMAVSAPVCSDECLETNLL